MDTTDVNRSKSENMTKLNNVWWRRIPILNFLAKIMTSWWSYTFFSQCKRISITAQTSPHTNSYYTGLNSQVEKIAFNKLVQCWYFHARHLALRTYHLLFFFSILMCWEHFQASLIMYAVCVYNSIYIAVCECFFSQNTSTLAMKNISFAVDVSFLTFHSFRLQKQKWIFTIFLESRIIAKR